MGDSDPGVPGSGWWFTPGGGIDPGETSLQAAVREVLEETGLLIEETELIGPIAVRTVMHGFSDQITRQHETFFAIEVPGPFDIAPAALTEDELVTLTGFRWMTLAEAAGEMVWPVELGVLLEADGSTLIDFGDVEESIIPV